MKLTDMQAILLAAAANRDDGLVPLTERLKGSAADKVARSLIDHGLATEVTVTRNDPFWREDEDGNAIALRVTRAGLEAVGIVDEADTATFMSESERSKPACAAGERAGRPQQGSPQGNVGADAEQDAASFPSAERRAPKRDTLIALLSRGEGASAAELMEVTGWLPHTVRAALTGLRKRGMDIRRFTGAGGTRYRVGAAEVSDCACCADGHDATGVAAG